MMYRIDLVFPDLIWMVSCMGSSYSWFYILSPVGNPAALGHRLWGMDLPFSLSYPFTYWFLCWTFQCFLSSVLFLRLVMNILVGWWGWGCTHVLVALRNVPGDGEGGRVLGFRETHQTQPHCKYLHTQGPVSLPAAVGFLVLPCITFPNLMGIKFLRASFLFLLQIAKFVSFTHFSVELFVLIVWSDSYPLYTLILAGLCVWRMLICALYPFCLLSFVEQAF